MMRHLSITVLVDNAVAATCGAACLVSEHGWSAWIEADGRRVLLDAGASDLVLRNAAALGVSIAEAEAVVLSHGHFDHTGGLAAVLPAAPRAVVHAHPAALGEHYSNHPGRGPRSIRMPEASAEALRAAGRSVVWTTSPVEVVPGVYVTGAIPRRTEFEDVGGPFFMDEAATCPDPIDDDQAAWIEGPTGIVVVLGCAHSGIVNTLEHVSRLAGGRPIVAVIGGTHLVSASSERLQRTAAALERIGLRTLGASHCTGAEAMTFLRQRFPETFLECGAGTRLTFGQ